MSIAALNWAWKIRLGDGHHIEKLVLLDLADHANDQNICWPSVTRISLRTELSGASVYRALTQLKAWDLVESQNRRTARGRQRSNVYYLRLAREQPQKIAEPIIPQRGGPSDSGNLSAITDACQEIEEVNSLAETRKSDSQDDNLQTLPGIVVCKNHQIEPSPLPPLSHKNPSGLPDGELRQRFNALADRYQIHGMASCAGDLGDAWTRFRKLTLDKIVMAEASIDNFIKGSKAAFARWKISKPQERARKAPKLRSLKDYFGFELWNSIGIPSEPRTEVANAAENAEIELCRTIMRMLSAPTDGTWEWVARGTHNWLQWQQYFLAHGFSRMPLRRAIFADIYSRNATRGEEGWVFPSALPPVKAELITEIDRQR